MIETNRLRLRLIAPEDAVWIARDICHPEVQRWLPFVPHPYGPADAEQFVARNIGNRWFRVIEAQGQPCGAVGVGPGPDGGDDMNELGYWLAVRAHGQGYMTEAAAALVDYAFANGVTTLHSGWMEGNHASDNVLTKLGFSHTGERVDRMVRFLGETRPVNRVRLDRDAWRGLETTRLTG